MGIALDYNLHRTAVDIGKGNRQMQKAATAYANANADSAANHLANALNDYGAALDHAGRAEENAGAEIGKELDKGNSELQKSIDAYGDGSMDSAQSHFDKAADHYDKVLDMLS